MLHPIKWFGFWLLLAGSLYLFGCSGSTADGPTAPHRGPGTVPDAGTPDTLVLADAVPIAPDVLPDTTPDTTPRPDVQAAQEVQTRLDTAPAPACEKIGAWSSTTAARMIPVEPTAYCFTICPVTEPSSPLDYAWACMGFTDVDRTITVNGQQVACGRPLPATANGGWTFTLAPGGHANDFINWTSPLRACP